MREFWETTLFYRAIFQQGYGLHLYNLNKET